MTTIEGGSIFSVRSFGAHFLYAEWKCMNNNDIPKKTIDVTGVELTPGEPDVCLGNGEQGFECCCDECDYFLLCFPEFDPQIREQDNNAT